MRPPSLDGDLHVEDRPWGQVVPQDPATEATGQPNLIRAFDAATLEDCALVLSEQLSQETVATAALSEALVLLGVDSFGLSEDLLC